MMRRAMTIAEKILARHSGTEVVGPGDVAVVDVDTAVVIDAPFASASMHADVTRVFDPDKIVAVADHLVPAPDIAAANGLRKMRQFVERFGIRNTFLEGNQGISHVVVAEHGYALPGTILACADSHTCSSGALNCLAQGLGSSEMVYVICKGRTWFVVGPTTKMELHGTLRPPVAARDVIHQIAKVHGDVAGRNLEWHGDGVTSLDMAARLTLATMSAELSAEFSLFPYDEVLEEYLRGRAKRKYEPAMPDPGATYDGIITVDLKDLSPQVVLPGKVAHNVADVGEVAGVSIDQAFIGSCANARLEDFAAAAEVVAGHRVAPGTRFIVTPGSQEVLRRAVAAGYVATLLEAGAVVTSSTCGACFGGHMGVLGDGEVCVTSSTRNFKGRMGSPHAEIYMASPATVAASAIRGSIADPRGM